MKVLVPAQLLMLGAYSALACMLLSAAQAEDTRAWKLSMSSGAEYDTNLHRFEVAGDEPIDKGSLLRSGANYQLSQQGDGRQLSLQLRADSKVFAVPEGQSENFLSYYGNLRYGRLLGKRKSIVALQANIYDALDIRPFGEGVRPTAGRSFRTASGEASLTLPGLGAHYLGLMVGLRDFHYKPDDDLSWRGPSFGSRYSHRFWRGDPAVDITAPSIDLRASYIASLRGYSGIAFANACGEQEMAAPECFVSTEAKRSDLHHAVIVEAVYTGQRIYSVLYGAEIIDSNSYGQASVRQRVALEATTKIVSRWYATVRGVIRFNTFLDPLLLTRDINSQNFVTLQDENRNSLSVHLSRDLSKHWGVEGRFAIYSNEFSDQPLRFRRQTFYLGLLYQFAADGQDQQDPSS